jgi:erythronate-4-phosphate dehydrogenase
MLIVCDDKIPFIRGVFEPYARVVYLPGSKTGPEEVRDADALITRTRTRCNASLLEGSRVKYIATATIGYDHIDTVWCQDQGIGWTNAPGCNSGSVRQYIGSVLALFAGLYHLNPEKMTLGVAGYGNVGSKVAKLAANAGMKVLVNDPPLERQQAAEGVKPEFSYVSLDFLLEKADIVTLHTPLTREGPDQTFHLMDEKNIAKMKAGSILINSSRGEVVSTEALRKALSTGHLRDAALDVWENEPDIDAYLLNRLSVTTPHIAGYSADGKANGTTRAVQAVARALDLPLKDWKVEQIPAPEQSLSFQLDAGGKTTAEVCCEAFLHTYPISEDIGRLKTDPGSFEKLRGEYPVRREFEAFTLNLCHAKDHTVNALRNLGFQVVQKF